MLRLPPGCSLGPLDSQLLGEMGIDFSPPEMGSSYIPISYIAQCSLVGSSWDRQVPPGSISALACRDSPNKLEAQSLFPHEEKK